MTKRNGKRTVASAICDRVAVVVHALIALETAAFGAFGAVPLFGMTPDSTEVWRAVFFVFLAVLIGFCTLRLARRRSLNALYIVIAVTLITHLFWWVLISGYDLSVQLAVYTVVAAVLVGWKRSLTP